MRLPIVGILFFAFTCFGQDSTRFFQKNNSVIELTPTFERFYELENQTSNAYPLRTYSLNEERDLREEEVFDPLAGKKKQRYQEISAKDAKKILLVDYISAHQRAIESQLAEKFNYFRGYFVSKSYYYFAVSNTCSTFQLKDTLSDVNTQRAQIDAYYSHEFDSLSLVHAHYNTLVSDFLASQEPLTYARTQQLLDQLPTMESLSGSYEATVLHEVVKQDPEIYYTYLASFEQTSKNYFMLPDSEGMKKVKRTESTSPIRKELIKYRRKQNWTTAAVLTGAVIIDAAVIGGIVYLITLLKSTTQ